MKSLKKKSGVFLTEYYYQRLCFYETGSDRFKL